jgi:hypothetical protein
MALGLALSFSQTKQKASGPRRQSVSQNRNSHEFPAVKTGNDRHFEQSVSQNRKE